MITPSDRICLRLPLSESLDDAVLPVPESVQPQTKAPLYGRDHISSRKAQAMRQARDRKKQLARQGPASHLDFSPLSLDKLEPEFVSEAEIANRGEIKIMKSGNFWGKL